MDSYQNYRICAHIGGQTFSEHLGDVICGQVAYTVVMSQTFCSQFGCYMPSPLPLFHYSLSYSIFSGYRNTQSIRISEGYSLRHPISIDNPYSAFMPKVREFAYVCPAGFFFISNHLQMRARICLIHSFPSEHYTFI